MKKTAQTTLKFLNAVERDLSENGEPLIDSSGVVVLNGARWALPEIFDYTRENSLSPEQLNKTFHKSWKTIKESSRLELLIHQILHYASTYGTDFCGDVYIPLEELDIPEKKLQVFVIQSLETEEIKVRLLSVLQSGVAMSQGDLEEIIEALTEMGHKFSHADKIRNKEAGILLAEKFNIYPTDPVEFLRFCVFKSTGKTLLIKNKDTYIAIHVSPFSPVGHFHRYGLDKLAAIFNRFKPIFLSYKTKCPREINKISKLSKTLHKPFVQSDLNFATRQIIDDVSGATTFALLRAWGAIHNARNLKYGRVFSIRNGKSFVTSKSADYDAEILDRNEKTIINELKKKIDLSQSVYIPQSVDYALPVSAKMFVGNFPTGTRFYGNNLAAGVYWENKGGARDIDLSGITAHGKVGWNSDYSQNGGALMYSGDMTDAEDGAVEYLYSDGSKYSPTILMANIFRGSSVAKYSVVVGNPPKQGRHHMMNPNKTICHAKTNAVQKQMILGLLFKKDEKQQAFSLVNVGAGSAQVSDSGKYTDTARDVFINKWSNCLTLREALSRLGILADSIDECSVDLSVDVVTKEKFIKIFGISSE